jgi:hypothetical protein
VHVLLDEQLPVALARLLQLAVALQRHDFITVVHRGWAGITNGELLQRMRGEFDALITVDRGIEFQQNLADLDFGVLLLRARSNRKIRSIG